MKIRHELIGEAKRRIGINDERRRFGIRIWDRFPKGGTGEAKSRWPKMRTTQ